MALFKYWLDLQEACQGYAIAALGKVISAAETVTEARKVRAHPQGRLFGSEVGADNPSRMPSKVIEPKKGLVDAQGCPITPLSGYARHIEKIKAYAWTNPDQMAHVMMFSPLSANTPFSKHWDNFHVLKLILKHYFPRKIDDPKKFEAVLDGFSDYRHSLAHTISGWKLRTVEEIWNNRESLFTELQNLAKEGDDVKLIARLCRITGVAPVKAGFIVQLLFGRSGCIDTHNIDIWSKAMPDEKEKFDPKHWKFDPEKPEDLTGVGKYVDLVNKMKDKYKIGTQQLWDVWVDFVEHFYLMTSENGKGNYADMGSSLDPNDPIYQAFKHIKIDKVRVGKGEDPENQVIEPDQFDPNNERKAKVVKGGRHAQVPIISGRYGMAGSATHLQMDPDDTLQHFHNMFVKGQEGPEAARSIPFSGGDVPLDKATGLGAVPSLHHYFGKYIGDPKGIRGEIERRLAKGGPKARRARAAAADAQQGGLF